MMKAAEEDPDSQDTYDEIELVSCPSPNDIQSDCGSSATNILPPGTKRTRQAPGTLQESADAANDSNDMEDDDEDQSFQVEE
jgi:hypothetical protein